MHLLHQPYEPFAYALTERSARLVLRAERHDVAGVTVHYGDRYESATTDKLAMTCVTAFSDLAAFTATVPVPTRRLKYTFEVHLVDGSRCYYGELGIEPVQRPENVFQLAYLTTRDLFRVPQWTETAVCYQVFPDRFARHQGAPDSATGAPFVPWDSEPTVGNRFGGTLAGITERLPYLAQLGVNVVYMTPVFRANSNHKYDTTDYYSIDPDFGSEADLRALVDTAHSLGIRVLLDAVFNHCGFDFAPFADCREKGRSSPYWDWFFIDGDAVDAQVVNYETFGTRIAYMPKLNFANPDAEAYFLGVAEYWIRACGIDGWRLDVANEVDKVFWRRFRAVVKAANPDALILGEVWHNALPWLQGDTFDGVMNYLFRDAALAFLVKKESSAQAFAAALEEIFGMYPIQAIQCGFNLLGSHDTPRLLTLAQGDVGRVLQAFVLQMTVPGLPMVYYGDEIGMQGGADPGCRGGMVWDRDRQHPGLQSALTRLVALRRTEPALAGTELRVVQAEDGVVVYQRPAPDGTAVWVAIHAGETAQALDIPETAERLYQTSPQAMDGNAIAPGSAVVWKTKTR